MRTPLNSILVIRLSSLGDIVLSSLLVRVLRKTFPSARIDYLLKEEYASLMQYNKHLSTVIEFPKDGNFNDVRRFRKRISSTGYDLIVDLHGSLRSRVMCLGSKRVVRISKRVLARFFLIQFHWNLYNRFGGAPSVAERYVETVKEFGVTDDGRGLEIHAETSNTQRAETLLRELQIRSGTRVLGLCPSARHENKMWPAERFTEAAVRLSDTFDAVLIFGSASESERCLEIAATIQQQKGLRAVNLAGKISILETAAMMDHCSLIITNDSGLMHVASARQRPVVALFGPTTRELGFFPFRTRSSVIEHNTLSCRPCTHIGLPACPLGHFRCMLELDVSRVVDASRSLLTS